MNDSVLICPECQTANPVDARECSQCGYRFDVVGQILAREQLRSEDRFTRRARDVPELKAQQADASRQRMVQFWAEDQQRRAALAAQQRKQKVQERRLMIGAVILLVVVLTVVLVIAVRG